MQGPPRQASMSSTAGTPVVPPWATSLLGGSQRTTPNAAMERTGQPVFGKGKDSAATHLLDSGSDEVLAVEMDDEDDADYDDEEDMDEDDDDEDMGEVDESGGLAAGSSAIPRNPAQTLQSLEPVQGSATTAPGSAGHNTMSSRLMDRAQDLWKKRGSSRDGAKGSLSGYPGASAESPVSSSSGSDIPATLPSTKRHMPRSSSRVAAEVSVWRARDSADDASGGPVTKRTRISKVADDVLTSRLNENDLFDALRMSRRSTTALQQGSPEAPDASNGQNTLDSMGASMGSIVKPSKSTSNGDEGSLPYDRGEDSNMPQQLDTAADGRLYSCGPGLSPSIKTKGALFPTGYPALSDAQSLFVCAVRNCQTMLPTLSGLGSHLVSKHALSTFNDNLDGTMSQVGTYKMPPSGKGHPIIVSRGPPRPDEAPPAEATMPKLVKRRMLLRGAETLPWWEDAALERYEPSMRPKGSEVFFYLKEKLPRGSKLHTRGLLGSMLRLEQLRPFPPRWKGIQRAGDRLDYSSILALAAYITGVKVSEPCDHCRDSPVGFQCVVPAPEAPAVVKEKMGSSCVMCLYLNYIQGRHPCRIAEPMELIARQPNLPSAPSSSGTPDDLGSSGGGNGRLGSSMEPQRPARGTSLRMSTVAAAMPADFASTSGAAMFPGRGANSSNVGPGNVPSADMLEMESWELAPGHIKDVSGGNSGENVAFSNAYVMSNTAVPIAADVGFNVATLKPGGSYKLEADARVLRVCSVASGKVRVKLDEKRFQIGRNGVFKVRGGSTATVENRLYIDSVLHISTITEF